MYEIDKLSYLQIGVQGDNESTDIVIDVTAWAEKYPEAEFFIVFKPYNAQEISPMLTSYDDGILTWTVNSAATAVTGVGYTEVRAQDSHGLIKKSRIIPTAVENSVSGVDDTPPAAYQEWVTAVLNAGATAKNAAAAAMAVSEGREIRFEIGTDDSPTGTSGHLLFYYMDDDDEWAYLDLGAVDAYGLAKAGGYTGTKTAFQTDMGNSGTNATSAAISSEDAEAFAIGKRNGEDVTSGDAAYHNNSKYWSGIAEAAAATASAAYGTDLLAPAYTDLTFPVKKGDHCIYSGGYYEAKQDIADSEVWTAAHWTQVTVGGESSDLKDTIAPFYHDEQLVLGSTGIVNCIISANTGKWSANAQNNKTYMLPVPENAIAIVITANATLSAYVAFLTTNSAVSGEKPDFVPGTSQSEITAGETGRFSIPAACQYIAIRYTSSAGDSTPSYIAVSVPNDYLTDNDLDGKTALAVDGLTDSAYINYADGQETSGSSALKCTGFIDVSECTMIRYSRIYSTSSTTGAGMAFYSSDKTFLSGQRCVLGQSVTHYEDEDIAVPSGTVYARFTLNTNLDGFGVYDISNYSESVGGRLDKLTGKVIPAPGKRVSILGDSISTFALEAGTGSGNKYAGEDCTTNYPGNRVRYPFNDVLNVDQIWWKIVLDYFGWELGINDSWAGSRIAWTGDETTTTGADIYIGSPTRIGHLDDNGTPDVIFVFGGTNDINHLGTANIGTLPTADPTGYTQSDLDALSVDKFKAAVVAMVLRLQYAYPNAQIIALIPYFVNQNYGNSTPYTVKLFDDALIECYDYLGVDYIDLRKIVNVYDITSLLGDNLHPNANGMKLIASAVIQKIGNVFQVV